MRGLPFSAVVKDVQFFFSGYQIVDGEDGPSVLLCRENRGRGRPSGDGFVEFESQLEAKEAMSRDRQEMGGRYIELYMSSHEEYEHFKGRNGLGEERRQGPMPSSDVQLCIRMRGLPFTATVEDIQFFFSGADSPLEIVENGIHICYERSSRPSGQAFVEFKSEQEARRALQFDRKHMGSRYVELFICSKGEMQQSLSM